MTKQQPPVREISLPWGVILMFIVLGVWFAFLRPDYDDRDVYVATSPTATPTPPPTSTPTPTPPILAHTTSEPDPVVEHHEASTPAPTPVPVFAASQGSVRPLSASPVPAACFDHPDRFDWKKYALIVGFPPEVVESAEMAQIIQAESHGDLCAYNPSSGASCWIQQVPGGAQFFDPVTCMSQGYAKYLDGARNYPDRSPWWQHWYQWWGR